MIELLSNSDIKYEVYKDTNPTGYGTQEIFIARIPKKVYTPTLIQFNGVMCPSEYAKKVNASIAINGGLYSTSNHMVPMPVRTQGIDRYNPYWYDDGLVNGFIAFDGENSHIFMKTNEEYGRERCKYDNQLAAGPVLLLDNKEISIIETSYTTEDNPRTIFGYDNTYFFAIVIDGRRKAAAGMCLTEAKDYCKSIGLTSAISLDGGGSSVLYTMNTGVVNQPSDGEEREVANCIIF